jgi:hypothetical protein
MAWAWRHTSDGLAPCWVAEKLQPHWRCLLQSVVHRGALYYTIAVKHGCRRTHRGTQEWLLHTGVCAILISEKFPNIVSQLLQEALRMAEQWCGKTEISIHPQKVQHLDQYLKKPCHLDETLSRTLHFLQSVGMLNA